MIIKKVKKFIESEQLFEAGQRIIVGFSGGADSVALLCILTSLGYECIAAHCNFNLRGEESNRDALFAANYCKAHSIVYDTVDFDTVTFAKEKAISIEMAARDLRYEWFKQLCRKYDAQSIAVAHHADDSVETILLNLIRGTGIKGLTGIEVKNGVVIRPLLCLNRTEIEKFLTSLNQDYVTDSTNQEAIYLRNKIRLEVIPQLETINPSLKTAILHTATYLKQTEAIYLDYIEKAKKEIMQDDKINIIKLLSHISPQAILHEILAVYNFNTQTVENIFNALQTISGKQFYSDTHRLIKDRNYLLIEEQKDISDSTEFEIHENDSFLSFPFCLSIEVQNNDKEFCFDKDKNKLYVDKNKLIFPLVIRKWRQGDWLIPFGMKGRKKVSDFFTDNKFSLFEKENTWLLCSGSDIVWIIGHRSDERFRVSTSTSDILIINKYL